MKNHDLAAKLRDIKKKKKFLRTLQAGEDEYQKMEKRIANYEKKNGKITS